jgi:hypothetical protein
MCHERQLVIDILERSVYAHLREIKKGSIKILQRRRSFKKSSENNLKRMIKSDPITTQDLGTPCPFWEIEKQNGIGDVLDKFANFFLEKPYSMILLLIK